MYNSLSYQVPPSLWYLTPDGRNENHFDTLFRHESYENHRLAIYSLQNYFIIIIINSNNDVGNTFNYISRIMTFEFWPNDT